MILHYKDIDIKEEEIYFKKKIHLSNDFSFIPIQYNHQDFIIQAPTLFSPFNIKEYPNKILRFNHERGIVSYRELDFIAEIDKSLLFCEIKMCKSYNKRRKHLVSEAWKQVSKSSNIACQNYSLLRPLVIIVDMSFVLEIDNKKK